MNCFRSLFSACLSIAFYSGMVSFNMWDLSGAVWITEVGALNENGPEDEDGDQSDWIELFNDGATSLDLGGFYLADDPADLMQWRFPDGVFIHPGECLLVFASGKSRAIPGEPFHTNFKLSGDGEWVLLTSPDGSTVIHSVEYPQQAADISWGLAMDQRSWTFQEDALPFQWKASRSPDDQIEFLQSDWMNLQGWNSGTGWGLGYEFGTAPTGDARYSQSVQKLNPAGYWKLDEISGARQVANQGSSGSLGDGVVDGAVLFGEAPWNADSVAAARFQQAGAGKIDIPFNAALNPEVFTVELWARVDGSAGAYRSPVTSRDDHPQRGYIIYASASDRWEFWTGSGEQSGWNSLSGPAVQLGKWVYLVGVYDGESMKFYVDGVLVAERAAVFGPNQARPLRIGGGATEGSGQYFFDGAVDELAVYPVPLNSETIREHYELGIPRIDPVTGERMTRDYDAFIQTDISSEKSEELHGVFVRSILDVDVDGFNELNADPAFEMATGDIGFWPFHQWEVGLQYDDGYALYWNGKLLQRSNVPGVDLSWNSLALERRPDRQAVEMEWTVLSWADALEAGWVWSANTQNDLGIHVLNSDQGNDPDLLIYPRFIGKQWKAQDPSNWTYFANPTPGQPNLIPDDQPAAGPVIREITQTPVHPGEVDPVIVEVETQALQGQTVETVTLHYRIMYQEENVLPMNDQGLLGDRLAGDGIFSAIIPPRVDNSQRMVRYRIEATDNQEAKTFFPAPEDQSGDRQSPRYSGWVDNAQMDQDGIPVFYWYSESPQQAHTRAGARVAVFWQGDFIDNAFARERGQATAFGSQKFEFDADNQIRLVEGLPRVRDLNLNSNGADPTYLRQPLAFQIFRDLGAAAPLSFPVEMRVNGGFDRVGIVIEQVDEDFLRRNGLDPDGALYKFVQRRELTPAFNDITDGLEKKTRVEEDFSDLAEIVEGLKSRDRDEVSAMMFEQLDLPPVINYLALRALVRDVDSIRKNFYFYRDTQGNRKWQFFPWDKDLCLGTGFSDTVGSHPFLGSQPLPIPYFDQWNVLMDAIYKDPWIRAMYLRRLRTLMDRVLATGAGSDTQFFSSRALDLAGQVGAYVSGGERGAAAPVFDFWNRHRDFMYRVHVLDSGDPEPFPAVGAASAGIPTALDEQSDPTVKMEPVLLVSGNEDSYRDGAVVIQVTGSEAIDMSGWSLRGAIEYQFPPGFVLPGGKKVALAESWLDGAGVERRLKEPVFENEPEWKVSGLRWDWQNLPGHEKRSVELWSSREVLIDQYAYPEIGNAGDDDVDGIPDQWERYYFGGTNLSDENSDSDRDGISDLTEYQLGKDPTQTESQDWMKLLWDFNAERWQVMALVGVYTEAAYGENVENLVIELQQAVANRSEPGAVLVETWQTLRQSILTLSEIRQSGGNTFEAAIDLGPDLPGDSGVQWFRIRLKLE